LNEENNELMGKLSIIAKLMYVQTRPRIEELKTELLKTPQQKQAYDALDGQKTIKEVATSAGYSSTRQLEDMLPEWERKGLILSSGKGRTKKYSNIESLEV
jgi:hypothetical protein